MHEISLNWDIHFRSLLLTYYKIYKIYKHYIQFDLHLGNLTHIYI